MASHRVARRLTEDMTGGMTQKVLIDDSPPAPATAGSLYEPMEEGATIDCEMRRRLAEGDLRKVDR